MIKKPFMQYVDYVHVCGEGGKVLEEIKDSERLGYNVEILLTALDILANNPEAQHVYFYGSERNQIETVNREDIPGIFGIEHLVEKIQPPLPPPPPPCPLLQDCETATPRKVIEVAEINNAFLHSLVDDTDFDELTLPQVRKLITFVGEAYMQAFLKK